MTAADLTAVRVEQFPAHPPAKVGRVLTEPELIAQWLMPGDFRLEVGHRYTMQARAVPGTGFSGTIQAEVVAFEPERRPCIGWRDVDRDSPNAAGWTITWTPRPRAAAPGSSSPTRAPTLTTRSTSAPAPSWAGAGAPS